jgi:hypothetical protein
LESTSQDFVDEALKIVNEAQKNGTALRLMGAVAIALHCPQFRYIQEKMKRQLTDLDFMTYSKYRGDLKQFFNNLGYFTDPKVDALYGYKRKIYRNRTTGRVADVFFDELEMSHTVDFRGRLELDFPTITLTDLLLEKMQIVRINEKDVKDTIILLREHQTGNIEKETVNGEYVADILSKDWGFYYTVTQNLKKVKGVAGNYAQLGRADVEDVQMKVDRLLSLIENRPKSLRWKMRARLGTRKIWYNEVEEAAREEVRIG